jgi:hypothetical protein
MSSKRSKQQKRVSKCMDLDQLQHLETTHYPLGALVSPTG